MSTKFTVIAAIVIAGAVLFAACSSSSKKSDDKAVDETTTTEAEVQADEDEGGAGDGEDEAAAFLEHAMDHMAMLEITHRHYITGATVSPPYLLVTAQLTSDDAETARELCNALVAASYSSDWSWSKVQIEPIDGGVAAECERRS